MIIWFCSCAYVRLPWWRRPVPIGWHWVPDAVPIIRHLVVVDSGLLPITLWRSVVDKRIVRSVRKASVWPVILPNWLICCDLTGLNCLIFSTLSTIPWHTLNILSLYHIIRIYHQQIVVCYEFYWFLCVSKCLAFVTEWTNDHMCEVEMCGNGF